jgi:hypothetical protein
MLLLQPNRTGLRLELVFVPLLAVGLALAFEPAVAWLRGRWSRAAPESADPAPG